MDQCESLKGDEPQSISVRIVNQSSSPIFIYNECYAAGLDGVRIDGSSLDGWTNYTCDDYLSGNCRGMDCFGNPPLELPTGEEHVDTWSGLVHEKDSTSIPEECTNDCFNAPSVCTRAIAAEPGEYSVSVRYYSDQTTGYVTTERTFTMPTSEITVEITD